MRKLYESLSPGFRRLNVGVVCIVASVTFQGCSTRESSYDRLCRIYEEFDGQPTSSELAVEISKRVGSKLPDLYSDYHVVMTAGSEERYEMFRMLARERAHQDNWSCDAIRRRYPSHE
jgi:hypothetical protein